MDKRLKLHYTYMKIAQTLAMLSYANRKKVGAILVKDNNIISTGYNGTPIGFDNTCEINDITVPEVLHAESNAIIKCAKSAYSSENSILYVTLSPCYECSKLIIQSGITEIYYLEKYRDTSGLDLLKKANILTIELNKKEYEQHHKN